MRLQKRLPLLPNQPTDNKQTVYYNGYVYTVNEARDVASAVVVEDIGDDTHTGRVETPDHMTWTALSHDGTPIEAGAQVRVVGQDSIKLVVERI